MKILSSYLAKAYLVLVLFSLIYLGFLLRDGRWFFYDDFAALRYVNNRSYTQIISNSFVTRDVDYHKFLGYLVIKFLYSRFGTNFTPFLLTNFLVHTTNAILVFEILWVATKQRGVSLVLAGVFLVRLWLWWPSNLHDLLAGTWYFAALLVWIRLGGKNLSNSPKWTNLTVLGLYLLGLATKATVVSLPIGLFLVSLIFERKKWLQIGMRLMPLILVMAGYAMYFGSYFGRGIHQGTGYATKLSIGAFIGSQIEFAKGINPNLDRIALLVLTGLLVLFGIGRRWAIGWLLVAAYAVAIAPMSFFKAHASPYYIYIPIVYVLMGAGMVVKSKIKNEKSKIWIKNQSFLVIWIVLVMVLFNPTAEFRKMVTKYRHPELVGFDQRNMEKLAARTREAVVRGEKEFYFSSWEMSPNLYSAVYHDALGLFLGGGEFNAYRFGYDRNRQVVVIQERLR